MKGVYDHNNMRLNLFVIRFVTVTYDSRRHANTDCTMALFASFRNQLLFTAFGIIYNFDIGLFAKRARACLPACFTLGNILGAYLSSKQTITSRYDPHTKLHLQVFRLHPISPVRSQRLKPPFQCINPACMTGVHF